MLLRADSSPDEESSMRSSASSTDSWRQKVALSRGDRSPVRGSKSPARGDSCPGRDAVALVMGVAGREAAAAGARAQGSCSARESVDDMNVAQLKARAMEVRKGRRGKAVTLSFACARGNIRIKSAL